MDHIAVWVLEYDDEDPSASGVRVAGPEDFDKGALVSEHEDTDSWTKSVSRSFHIDPSQKGRRGTASSFARVSSAPFSALRRMQIR